MTAHKPFTTVHYDNGLKQSIIQCERNKIYPYNSKSVTIIDVKEYIQLRFVLYTKAFRLLMI